MKLSNDRLRMEFALARLVAPALSIWQHKKGGQYLVVTHAFDTARETINIIYARQGGPGYDAEAERGILFSRPVEEWTAERFTQLN